MNNHVFFAAAKLIYEQKGRQNGMKKGRDRLYKLVNEVIPMETYDSLRGFDIDDKLNNIISVIEAEEYEIEINIRTIQ